MKEQEKADPETYRELLRQHWLHCRHIESERAWFMSVYAAIIGGVLSFTFADGVHEIWPLAFLIFLTCTGLILNIRWMQSFEHHRRMVKKAAAKLNIEADIDVPAGNIWRILRTRNLFPSFYIITLIGLIILLLTN